MASERDPAIWPSEHADRGDLLERSPAATKLIYRHLSVASASLRLHHPHPRSLSLVVSIAVFLIAFDRHRHVEIRKGEAHPRTQEFSAPRIPEHLPAFLVATRVVWHGEGKRGGENEFLPHVVSARRSGRYGGIGPAQGLNRASRTPPTEDAMERGDREDAQGE